MRVTHILILALCMILLAACGSSQPAPGTAYRDKVKEAMTKLALTQQEWVDTLNGEGCSDGLDVCLLRVAHHMDDAATAFDTLKAPTGFEAVDQHYKTYSGHVHALANCLRNGSSACMDLEIAGMKKEKASADALLAKLP